MERFIGQVLRGRVKKFKEGWGFINGEAFDSDLFVGLKENPHLDVQLRPDDEVEFEVALRGNKAMAVNVQLVNASDSAVLPLQTSGQGTRHHGTVKSFKDTWGFIVSPEISGDLFVGLRTNPFLRAQDLVEGQEVEFEVLTRPDGKHEAVSVTVLQRRAQVKEEEVQQLFGRYLEGTVKEFDGEFGYIISDEFSGELIFQMATGDNPQLAEVEVGDTVTFLMEAEGANFRAVNVQQSETQKQDLNDLARSRALVMGKVKRFRGSWGFINSRRFEGDLFVGLKENKHLEPEGLVQGEDVEFEVKEETKADGAVGHQAMRVRRLAAQMKTELTQGSQGASMSSAAPHPNSEAERALVDALARHGPTMVECFAPALKVLANAPPEALKKLAEVLVPFAQERGLAEKQLNVRRRKKRPEALLGTRMQGTVARLQGDAHSDYAVIVSEAFEGEVLAHQGSSMLCIGDTVDVTLIENPAKRGGVLGTSVAVVPPQLPKPQPGRRYVGQVRNFKGTWGFVTSDSFNGDLFVGMKTNSHLVTPLQPGDEVDFAVDTTNKGDMEAVNVVVRSVAMRGAPPRMETRLGLPATRTQARSRSPARGRNNQRSPLDLIGHIVRGKIRSFKGNFGFAISDYFDGDVFIGMGQNRHLQREPVEGDIVSFQVSVSPSGKAEGINAQIVT